MKIAIAGGGGFLGTPLVESLARAGHEVLVLSRRPEATPAWAFVPDAAAPARHGVDPSRVRVAAWTPNGEAGPWAAALDGAGALVNLAGASLGDARWSPARKALLRDSRVLATRSLVEAMRRLPAPPPVFLSASGVGYYGLRGDEPLSESAPAGSDFLAALCVEWEAEARKAEAFTRVVLMRSAVVFGRGGGVLPRLIMPFRLFAGGRLGSGRQYLSWIHLEDWRRIALLALADRSLAGPVNAASPNPVTNREFARVAGHVLHRPAWLPAPSFALRLMLGEMAGPLVLGGQRAVPERALEHGFAFRFPDLRAALEDVL